MKKRNYEKIKTPKGSPKKKHDLGSPKNKYLYDIFKHEIKTLHFPEM